MELTYLALQLLNNLAPAPACYVDLATLETLDELEKPMRMQMRLMMVKTNPPMPVYLPQPLLLDLAPVPTCYISLPTLEM
jgi:hypothetical protein